VWTIEGEPAMTKNITLAIDEAIIEKVRVVAAQRKTTVNGLVRDFLTSVASEDDRRAEARRRLVELAETSEARLGPDYKWNRDEIYEERLRPRHERPDLRDSGEGR
jgi:hypothetical protein